jgi:hypothetical protein
VAAVSGQGGSREKGLDDMSTNIKINRASNGVDMIRHRFLPLLLKAHSNAQSD